jgi:hypothetical protein
MSIPAGHLIWGIRIEGLGDPALVNDPATEDARWRFATGLPYGDTHGLYRDVLMGLPEPISWRADPRDGHSSYGGTTLHLLHTHQVRGLLSRLRSYPTHRLVANLPADADLMEVEGAALTPGQTVWLRREALYVLSVEAPNTYRVLRGALSTPIQDHLVDRAGADLDLFTACHVLQARRVELFVITEGASYDEEIVVWSGLLDRVGALPADTAVSIELLGPLALLARLRLLPRPWEGEVYNVFYDGPIDDQNPSGLLYVRSSSRAADLDIPAQPAGVTPEHGDQILLQIEGQLALATWRHNAGNGYWLVEPNPWQDLTDPIPDDERIKLVARRATARQVFSAHPQAPQRLGDDAIEIWLAVLTSTAGGGNGPYDRGWELGVGLPYTAFDLDGLERLRAQWAPLLRAPLFFVGREDEPAEVQRKLREELLAPMGLIETVTSDARLSLALWSELPVGYAEVHLSNDNVLELISQDYGWDSVLDQIVYEYTPEGHLLDEPRLVDLSNGTTRQRVLGALRDLRVNGRVISDYAQAYALALSALLRWRDPMPVLTVATHLSAEIALWRTCLLSHEALATMEGPSPSSGVISTRCLAIGRTIDPGRGENVYTLLHLGLDQHRLGRIAPSAQVTAWNPGTSLLTLAPNVYSLSPGVAYATDREPFAVDHVCHAITPEGLLVGVAVILAVEPTPDQLTIALGQPTDPPPMEAGVVLVNAPYDDQTEPQRQRDISLADDTETIPDAGDPGYQFI